MKNVKLLLVSIFISSLLLSCKGVLNSDIKYPKIDGTEYTILKFNPKETYPLFKNSKPTTLSYEEIVEIEKIVGLKVSEIITNHNLERKKADSYVRQYVAAINENGEKEVWINIYCNDLNSTEWKKEVVRIGDGGDCAFNLKANLSKQIYYDLMINFTA